MARIAVVGAGLAGLTCAQALQAAGTEVVVLEKSRGAGGRLSTRRTEAAHYDHGTQYFTVRDPRFDAFIQAQMADGTVAVWKPRIDPKGVQRQLDPWYVGTPGMSSLGRAQAVGLDLRTEMRVQSMAKLGQTWQLVMEDQAVLDRFDAVVVAVPNAQAVPLLQPLAPSWAQQLQQIDMQPCWTLMVSTTDGLTEFDAGLPHSGAIGWWARNSSKPGRPVQAGRHDWVIQATSAWTQAHLQAPKDEVQQAMLEAFAQELDVPSIELTQPVMVHRWLYARRQADIAAPAQPWWIPEAGLGVCGDGLVRSRVEQAYLSGLELADAMADVAA